MQPRDDSEMSHDRTGNGRPAFGGSRRADTASDSSNRLASLGLGLSEPFAHRVANGDALHVLSAIEKREVAILIVGRIATVAREAGVSFKVRLEDAT